MENRNEQPSRRGPMWLWLILLLVVIALFFVFRSCNGEKSATENGTDTTHLNSGNEGAMAVTVPDWSMVDFDAPNIKDDNISDAGIILRGKDNYVIYGLGENVLFASGESAIQAAAHTQLKQIAASLKKRFGAADIAVYGSTDSVGSASDNKQLGAERAAAVKKWLMENAGVAADKISVQSKGQSDPVATNATAKGREMNRNVEIVAMNR